MALDVLCLMTAFFTSLEIESPGKNTRPPATANLQQTLAALAVWSHCPPVDVSLGLFTRRTTTASGWEQAGWLRDPATCQSRA
jgi:hypothetical protein